MTALTLADELRHLREGAGDEPAPDELDALEAECPRGGEATLRRVREVLEVVLGRSSGEWPGLEEWKRALPGWFVESCVDDAQLRDCVIDKWSLRAWVYWFQPGMRKWRWWDARAGSGNLEVRILVLERPYLRGALEWLLKVAAS
ncbi:MAG: hypothetical protein J2P45_19880 [Candidatus Dormibacteraeota bacterium]|nr:hypothetical protein [Candidatus Dormibacteraeota bacterium]